MKAFDYVAPATLPEAVAHLEQHGDSAKVLAGGTDLLVAIKESIVSAALVIDLKRIPELSFIRSDGSGALAIGALTTLSELAASETLRTQFTAISEAADSVGSPQIRNRATVGGNLCNAAPSADLAPPLIALDAKAVISGPKGERIVPVEKLFKGPKETVLAPDELLTEIRISKAPEAGSYIKRATRRADIAVVGVAAALFPGNRVSLVLGAVAPTPIRAVKAEALLDGGTLTEQLLEQIAEKAVEDSSPISDIRASAWYRREIIKVLVMRAVRRVLPRNDGKLHRGRPS